MTYTVHLYDRDNGKRGTFEYSQEWYQLNSYGEAVGSEFFWEDGNGACDCNRMAYLYCDDETDFVCAQPGYGRENRIIVEKIILPDGTTVYEEPLP